MHEETTWPNNINGFSLFLFGIFRQIFLSFQTCWLRINIGWFLKMYARTHDLKDKKIWQIYQDIQFIKKLL